MTDSPCYIMYNNSYTMYEDAIIKKYQTSLNPDSKPHEIEKFFNDISQDKEFPGIHIVRDLISSSPGWMPRCFLWAQK